jgi:hypothetical protein
MIDCSPAEIAAIKEVFPTTNILLCHWHIKRAWKTHIKKDVGKKNFFFQLHRHRHRHQNKMNDDTDTVKIVIHQPKKIRVLIPQNARITLTLNS